MLGGVWDTRSFHQSADVESQAILTGQWMCTLLSTPREPSPKHCALWSLPCGLPRGLVGMGGIVKGTSVAGAGCPVGTSVQTAQGSTQCPGPEQAMVVPTLGTQQCKEPLGRSQVAPSQAGAPLGASSPPARGFLCRQGHLQAGIGPGVPWGPCLCMCLSPQA